MEFDINGQAYRTVKMDVLRQFHISRKIGPVLPTLLPIFGQLAKDAKAASEAQKRGEPLDKEAALTMSLNTFGSVLGPFTDALAALKEEDVNYIIDSCLTTVSRRTDKNWSKIGTGSVLMFDDIDLSVVFDMVVKVIWDNLGPFINGFLTKNPAPTVTP